jgi:hypothetical protein
MTSSVPFWLQLLSILLAPLLGLIGVTYGSVLARSAEHRRWVREEKLKAYAEFVTQCTSYVLAFRQLTYGMEARSQNEMVKGRDGAIAAIERIEAQRQAVLLLGSQHVEQACGEATASIAHAQTCLTKIIEGGSAHAGDDDWPSALADVRRGIDNFRTAVRREILPRRWAEVSGRAEDGTPDSPPGPRAL